MVTFRPGHRRNEVAMLRRDPDAVSAAAAVTPALASNIQFDDLGVRQQIERALAELGRDRVSRLIRIIADKANRHKDNFIHSYYLLCLRKKLILSE